MSEETGKWPTVLVNLDARVDANRNPSTASTTSRPPSTVSRKTARPKSTPASLRVGFDDRFSKPRPNTAIGLESSGCDRLYQVEYEPTRKHNLENHLPLRKSKPPPWQKQSEPPLVPYVVAPHYILSKSKCKIAVTLKEDLFETEVEEIPRPRQTDPERDSLIAALQQQIADLQLYLEEERLNHRITRQQAAEHLKDKLDEFHHQHQHHIRELELQHEEDLAQQQAIFNDEFSKQKAASDLTISKMKTEIEFLQGAFESYKTTVMVEMEEKWKRKELELEKKHEEQLQSMIQEQRSKMIAEKNAELASQAKEFQREKALMLKEHKREIDSMLRKFKKAVEDQEKLAELEKLLKETEQEIAELKKQYDQTCTKMADLAQELAETKMKLLGYENNFEDKVMEVDDKYRNQIEDLLVQNTELRQLYMKKCGELFDEKAGNEQIRYQNLENAKETMKMLIHTRNRNNVNLTAGDPLLDKQDRQSKFRPISAPITKEEADSAYISAGETQEALSQMRTRPHTSVPWYRAFQEEENPLILPGRESEIESLKDAITMWNYKT